MKEICIGDKCITLPELKKRLKTYISDVDLKGYFGPKFEIVKYQHLDNYQNIEQLLPKNKTFIIILIEWELNTGHWVLLSRYKDKGKDILEYFNSYSAFPSSELQLLDDKKRIELDECEKHLNILLNKALNKYQIIYNKYPLQSTKKIRGVDIGTCGVHCIIRCVMMLHYNFNLQQYLNWLKEIKKDTGLSYDEIVVIIVFGN
jgi:hypothetical protein